MYIQHVCTYSESDLLVATVLPVYSTGREATVRRH